MSRVGRQPVPVPVGVAVEVVGGKVVVSGSVGRLERVVRPEVVVKFERGFLYLAPVSDGFANYHGTERSLLNNMVKGVSEGFVKELELVGVGYRAEQKGNVLELGLGYSHVINFVVPDGVTGSVLKDGRQIFIKLHGADKQKVGQVAAEIRSLRKPEPYKGKGVRYKGEEIKLKAGKTSKK